MTSQDSNGKVNPIGMVNPLPEAFYLDFLSMDARGRKPSAIRSLFPLEDTPGLISLLAGKPNAATFPFKSLSFTIDSFVEKDQDVTLTINPVDLAEGLQYGPTAGIPKLIDWLKGLQGHSHSRKAGEGWDISVGTGSQDLINKAVTALVNPGDTVLLESPVYAGVLPMFQNIHCEQIEVETDANGISSSSLRSILENWPANKPKPRVLYTVPYGCNPTGRTATVERRREVLRLAHEHNFIILEDDPYFYLYYGEAAKYPSYFALELEHSTVGRVLRFDSFSKVLSAGIRIGFASGPKRLLTAINAHSATANLHTSSLSQVIIATLLQSWGYDGFEKHIANVSKFYKEKRDRFERGMQTHLSGLAEWEPPEAGMFYWFKLKVGRGQGEGDSESVIRKNAFERGVLALPGTVFLPNGRKTSYVRAAFSLIREEEVDEALKRLRQAIIDAQEATHAA